MVNVLLFFIFGLVLLLVRQNSRLRSAYPNPIEAKYIIASPPVHHPAPPGNAPAVIVVLILALGIGVYFLYDVHVEINDGKIENGGYIYSAPEEEPPLNPAEVPSEPELKVTDRSDLATFDNW